MMKYFSICLVCCHSRRAIGRRSRSNHVCVRTGLVFDARVCRVADHSRCLGSAVQRQPSHYRLCFAFHSTAKGALSLLVVITPSPTKRQPAPVQDEKNRSFWNRPAGFILPGTTSLFL